MTENMNKTRSLTMSCLLILTFLLLSSCSYLKSAVKEEPAFDAAASLNKANQLIESGNYEDARVILEEIKAKDASEQYAMMARVRIADSYYEDELYEEAAVEYESFIGMHADHKYAAYAQSMLAMTYFKRIKTPDVSYSWAAKAREEFEKLRRNYPRNPYMDITESRIKMCNRILAEYEFYVGNFYFKKGSYQAAIDRFNDMLKTYPDSKMESDALYYIGLSYENLGQRDKAISILKALVEKFPTTELSGEARKLLASFNK